MFLCLYTLWKHELRGKGKKKKKVINEYQGRGEQTAIVVWSWQGLATKQTQRDNAE